MSVKELKPKLDPETCAVCGRRLLQGEQIHWYLAPDSSRRVVCELCVPRAERARWVREREGGTERMMPLRPPRAARGGLIKRIGDFFGAGGEGELELEQFEPADRSVGEQHTRRRDRAVRRRERDKKAAPPPPSVAEQPRSVRAVPTGPTAKLAQGLELFNASQFPRTIAGLSRSLGDPQVAAVNHNDSSVEVYVGWDIVWYSYRVDLGDATEPVEQSGRGNDTVELTGIVSEWNATADSYGRLLLRASDSTIEKSESGADSPIEHDDDEPPESDDHPPVYGGGA